MIGVGRPRSSSTPFVDTQSLTWTAAGRARRAAPTAGPGPTWPSPLHGESTHPAGVECRSIPTPTRAPLRAMFGCPLPIGQRRTMTGVSSRSTGKTCADPSRSGSPVWAASRRDYLKSRVRQQLHLYPAFCLPVRRVCGAASRTYREQGSAGAVSPAEVNLGKSVTSGARSLAISTSAQRVPSGASASSPNGRGPAGHASHRTPKEIRCPATAPHSRSCP